MMVVVTYDVNTETPEGKRRLRNIANVCKDYGLRVQNSVFECVVSPAQEVELKKRLLEIINEDSDSLRLYNLGGNYRSRIEHIGSKNVFDIDNIMIL